MTLQLSLRDLFAAAYLEGLEQKARLHPLSTPTPAPRLDDTGRAPNVPLAAVGAPCRNCSSQSITDGMHIYGELVCCPDCDHRG